MLVTLAPCHLAAAPTDLTYKRWGVYQPLSSPEPNNKFPPEDCAVANFSQATSGVASWSDTNCFGNFAFMCKIPGGQRAGYLDLAVSVAVGRASALFSWLGAPHVCKLVETGKQVRSVVQG